VARTYIQAKLKKQSKVFESIDSEIQLV